MAIRLDIGDKDFETAFRALLDTKRETEPGVDDAVRAILADVRELGDAAAIAYTRDSSAFALTSETMST